MAKTFTGRNQLADSLMAEVVKARNLKIDNPKAAIAIVERLLADNPNSHVLKGLMAECLLNDGRLEEALKWAEGSVPFKKKGKRSKEDQIAWFIYAKILHALKRNEEALEACNKSGDDPDPSRLRTRLEMFLEDKNRPKYVSLVESAKEIWQRDHAGALALLEEAEELIINPNPEIDMLRARIYFQTGKHKSALASAEKAYALGKTDAESVALLNDIRRKCGKKLVGEGNGPLAAGLAMLLEKGLKPVMPESKQQQSSFGVKSETGNQAGVICEGGVEQSESSTKSKDCPERSEQKEIPVRVCMTSCTLPELVDVSNLDGEKDMHQPEQEESCLAIEQPSEEVGKETPQYSFYDSQEVASSADEVGVVQENKPVLSEQIKTKLCSINKLAREGKYAEAILEMLDIAVEADGIAEFHRLKSAVYLSLGKLEQAESSARQAVCLDPLDSYFFTNLSKILSYAGKLEEALLYAKEAARLSNYPDNFINLAEIQRKLKRYNEALETLRLAGNSAKVNVCAAYSYMHLGRFREAVDCLWTAKRQTADEPNGDGMLLRINCGILFVLDSASVFLSSPEFKRAIAEAVEFFAGLPEDSGTNLQKRDLAAAQKIINCYNLSSASRSNS